MAADMAIHASEMTVSELRALIREIVRETVQEIVDQTAQQIGAQINDILLELHSIQSDLDEYLALKPAVMKRLQAALKTPLEEKQSKSLDEVVSEMGLDD